MARVLIDRRFDALIVNDLQKDFLAENGKFPQIGAEIVSQKLFGLLPFFPLASIYFLLHAHKIEIFKNYPDLRHCVIFPKITFVASSKPKQLSEFGVSSGFEFEDNLSNYLFKEYFKGNPVKRFYKLGCPFLGSQFSILQACKIDEYLLKTNVRRIFFTGLHFNPCIINEIYYLERKKNFTIFIVNDLICSGDEKDKMALMESLRSRGVTIINSNELVKSIP